MLQHGDIISTGFDRCNQPKAKTISVFLLFLYLCVFPIPPSSICYTSVYIYTYIYVSRLNNTPTCKSILCIKAKRVADICCWLLLASNSSNERNKTKKQAEEEGFEKIK